MIKELEETLSTYNIKISHEKLKKMDIYIKELMDKNKKINLISRKDTDNIIKKHIPDSLMLTKTEKIENFSELNLLDIGSGGGFPAVPLAIYYDRINFYLAESVYKKYQFLLYIKEILKLPNLNVLNERITRYHSVKYDIITERASAKIEEMIELSSHLVKKGGYFVSWLSNQDLEKIKTDSRIEFIYNYILDGRERAIVFFRF